MKPSNRLCDTPRNVMVPIPSGSMILADEKRLNSIDEFLFACQKGFFICSPTVVSSL